MIIMIMITLRPQTDQQDFVSLSGFCMHNAQARWQK